MEGAFGWVTGCAWVDAVVSLSALAEYPTPVVTLKDVGLALASTLAGGAFLALRGEAPSLALADDQRASREEVELFFFTGAICWAVGWCWIVVLRDLATLLSPNAAGSTTSAPPLLLPLRPRPHVPAAALAPLLARRARRRE